MRVSSSAMRSALDHTALAASAHAPLTPRRQRPSLRWRHAGSRASRSRASSAQGILGPAVQLNADNAGAAAGDRDRGRGGARRSCRRAIADRGRCASPISAPARARSCWRCSPSCRGQLAASAPISAPPRSIAPATMPTRSAAHAASFVACDYGAALEGPFDLLVSNPPYVARGDIAMLAARGARFRSSPRARRRARRARRLSRDRRRRAAAACAGRHPRRGTRRRAGFGRHGALFAAAGLASADRDTIFAGIPQGSGRSAGCHEVVCIPRCKKALGLWHQDRLGFCDRNRPEMLERRLRAPKQDCGEPAARTERTKVAG